MTYLQRSWNRGDWSWCWVRGLPEGVGQGWGPGRLRLGQSGYSGYYRFADGLGFLAGDDGDKDCFIVWLPLHKTPQTAP
jgi:hypothetical protein